MQKNYLKNQVNELYDRQNKHFDIQYIKNDILNFYGFFYFYAAFNWNKHSNSDKFPCQEDCTSTRLRLLRPSSSSDHRSVSDG